MPSDYINYYVLQLSVNSLLIFIHYYNAGTTHAHITGVPEKGVAIFAPNSFAYVFSQIIAEHKNTPTIMFGSGLDTTQELLSDEE